MSERVSSYKSSPAESAESSLARRAAPSCGDALSSLLSEDPGPMEEDKIYLVKKRKAMYIQLHGSKNKKEE